MRENYKKKKCESEKKKYKTNTQCVYGLRFARSSESISLRFILNLYARLKLAHSVKTLVYIYYYIHKRGAAVCDITNFYIAFLFSILLLQRCCGYSFLNTSCVINLKI